MDLALWNLWEVAVFTGECNLLLVSHFCGFASYLITAWPWALQNLISLLPQNKPQWHDLPPLLDVFCFQLLFPLSFHCWHSSHNTVISVSLLLPLFSFGSEHEFQRNESYLSCFPKQSSVTSLAIWYTHPKWDFVHPSLHISLFFTIIISGMTNWWENLSQSQGDTSSYIIPFFPFPFFIFLFFSYFEDLTFRDTSFMFLQSVSKGQSMLQTELWLWYKSGYHPSLNHSSL